MGQDNQSSPIPDSTAKDPFFYYFEQVKDVLKHFFYIVSLILAISITLSGEDLPSFSKVMLIAGWACLIFALIQGAYAMDKLFWVYLNTIGFNYKCPPIANRDTIIVNISRKCHWCIKLFVFGLFLLGIAAVFRFK